MNNIDYFINTEYFGEDNEFINYGGNLDEVNKLEEVYQKSYSYPSKYAMALDKHNTFLKKLKKIYDITNDKLIKTLPVINENTKDTHTELMLQLENFINIDLQYFNKIYDRLNKNIGIGLDFLIIKKIVFEECKKAYLSSQTCKEIIDSYDKLNYQISLLFGVYTLLNQASQADILDNIKLHPSKFIPQKIEDNYTDKNRWIIHLLMCCYSFDNLPKIKFDNNEINNLITFLKNYIIEQIHNYSYESINTIIYNILNIQDNRKINENDINTLLTTLKLNYFFKEYNNDLPEEILELIIAYYNTTNNVIYCNFYHVWYRIDNNEAIIINIQDYKNEFNNNKWFVLYRESQLSGGSINNTIQSLFANCIIKRNIVSFAEKTKLIYEFVYYLIINNIYMNDIKNYAIDNKTLNQLKELSYLFQNKYSNEIQKIFDSYNEESYEYDSLSYNETEHSSPPSPRLNPDLSPSLSPRSMPQLSPQSSSSLSPRSMPQLSPQSSSSLFTVDGGQESVQVKFKNLYNKQRNEYLKTLLDLLNIDSKVILNQLVEKLYSTEFIINVLLEKLYEYSINKNVKDGNNIYIEEVYKIIGILIKFLDKDFNVKKINLNTKVNYLFLPLKVSYLINKLLSELFKLNNIKHNILKIQRLLDEYSSFCYINLKEEAIKRLKEYKFDLNNYNELINYLKENLIFNSSILETIEHKFIHKAYSYDIHEVINLINNLTVKTSKLYSKVNLVDEEYQKNQTQINKLLDINLKKLKLNLTNINYSSNVIEQIYTVSLSSRINTQKKNRISNLFSDDIKKLFEIFSNKLKNNKFNNINEVSLKQVEFEFFNFLLQTKKFDEMLQELYITFYNDSIIDIEFLLLQIILNRLTIEHNNIFFNVNAYLIDKAFQYNYINIDIKNIFISNIGKIEPHELVDNILNQYKSFINRKALVYNRPIFKNIDYFIRRISLEIGFDAATLLYQLLVTLYELYYYVERLLSFTNSFETNDDDFTLLNSINNNLKKIKEEVSNITITFNTVIIDLFTNKLQEVIDSLTKICDDLNEKKTSDLFNKFENLYKLISLIFELDFLTSFSKLSENIRNSTNIPYNIITELEFFENNYKIIYDLIIIFNKYIKDTELLNINISELFKKYYNSREKVLTKIKNIDDVDKELIKLYLFIEQYKFIQKNLNKKMSNLNKTFGIKLVNSKNHLNEINGIINCLKDKQKLVVSLTKNFTKISEYFYVNSNLKTLNTNNINQGTNSVTTSILPVVNIGGSNKFDNFINPSEETLLISNKIININKLQVNFNKELNLFPLITLFYKDFISKLNLLTKFINNLLPEPQTSSTQNSTIISLLDAWISFENNNCPKGQKSICDSNLQTIIENLKQLEGLYNSNDLNNINILLNTISVDIINITNKLEQYKTSLSILLKNISDIINIFKEISEDKIEIKLSRVLGEIQDTYLQSASRIIKNVLNTLIFNTNTYKTIKLLPKKILPKHIDIVFNINDVDKILNEIISTSSSSLILSSTKNKLLIEIENELNNCNTILFKNKLSENNYNKFLKYKLIKYYTYIVENYTNIQFDEYQQLRINKLLQLYENEVDINLRYNIYLPILCNIYLSMNIILSDNKNSIEKKLAHENINYYLYDIEFNKQKNNIKSSYLYSVGNTILINIEKAIFEEYIKYCLKHILHIDNSYTLYGILNVKFTKWNDNINIIFNKLKLIELTEVDYTKISSTSNTYNKCNHIKTFLNKIDFIRDSNLIEVFVNYFLLLLNNLENINYNNLVVIFSDKMNTLYDNNFSKLQPDINVDNRQRLNLEINIFLILQDIVHGKELFIIILYHFIKIIEDNTSLTNIDYLSKYINNNIREITLNLNKKGLHISHLIINENDVDKILNNENLQDRIILFYKIYEQYKLVLKKDLESFFNLLLSYFTLEGTVKFHYTLKEILYKRSYRRLSSSLSTLCLLHTDQSLIDEHTII